MITVTDTAGYSTSAYPELFVLFSRAFLASSSQKDAVDVWPTQVSSLWTQTNATLTCVAADAETLTQFQAKAKEVIL